MPGPTLRFLRPQVRERLLAAVRLGMSDAQAAACAGLHRDTLRRWLVKAADPDAPAHFRHFRRDLELARAEGILDLAEVIFRAADTDWRAAAHLLACRDPENWSLNRRHLVALTGASFPTIQVFQPDRLH